MPDPTVSRAFSFSATSRFIPHDLARFQIPYRHRWVGTTVGNLHVTEGLRLSVEEISNYLGAKGMVPTDVLEAEPHLQHETYIPVKLDTAGNAHHASAADLRIDGVIIGADQGQSNRPLETSGTQFEATLQQYISVHEALTFVATGSGGVIVSRYTGTDPDPADVTGLLSYVGTSATHCAVEVLSTVDLATAIGHRVLAVDTTTNLVAWAL